MTTAEVIEMEQFICSVFFLPKKCYPRFNSLQKQALSFSPRFQATVEKFHKLTKTKETKDLQQIRKTVKNLADAKEVQVAIFGKFHVEISSRNLFTAKESKYLMPDCVPSRFTRNEWMAQSVQCSDTDGTPVAHVYIVFVHKNDKLQDLAQDIQEEMSSLCLPSFKSSLLFVGLDPSLKREDSSMKRFEQALRNVFHNTTKRNVRGEGKELDNEHRVYFKSSSYEDFISSEGELPKMIQTHLEWMVVQPLLDMKGIIDSNTRIYKKNSEETFQGPVAVEECLKKRCLETFLTNQRYIVDSLLGKFFFQEGIIDCEKMAQVLLENLAQVMQCLMVEVLAKIYGIKEYHFHEMLEGMVFKEGCSNIIRHCIRENLFQSLPSYLFNYECKNLEKEERKKLSCLFSEIHEKFLDELKKTADTDLKVIAEIVHKELEERVKPTERNLAIQQKQKFEIECILEQAMVSNRKSYQLPLTTRLKDELLRIEGVEGVAMIYGKLHVHIIDFSNVKQEKEVLRQIDEVIVKNRYWQSYKIGVITKKPQQFCCVGVNLYCPALDRHGTLGGFMVDMNENLYFLTCAHIVPNNVDVHVEIKQEETYSLTLGRSVKLQVGTENHMMVDSVDIMAVRVNAEQSSICIPFFKTADGNFGQSVMVQPFDSSLREYHNIYKWGAYTNLTRGILHTGNYNKELFSDCGLNNSKYIYVLIDKSPVDDDNNETFAMPGDSGAIVCAEGEDEIQTIAMIQGGDMEIRNGTLLEKYTLGFYLWCGLDKLLQRSSLNLTTVSFSEEKLRHVLQISKEKHRQFLINNVQGYRND
ncbi:hypothetical protein CHS0354_014551 [Potamilus streckersoni]|uniref:Uncharacterized protein n=1 Tax=Potamilus streckersoni TaxID=2493646 RepID=A0AAE0RQS4_9BIVA|nr:hypothetical protein CHS0354_014551 [Potamilus streckersoni]